MSDLNQRTLDEIARGNDAAERAREEGNKTALQSKVNDLDERNEQFILEIAKMRRALFGSALSTSAIAFQAASAMQPKSAIKGLQPSMGFAKVLSSMGNVVKLGIEFKETLAKSARVSEKLVEQNAVYSSRYPAEAAGGPTSGTQGM